MSRDMRFPTMWYVRPAKPQISLHIGLSKYIHVNMPHCLKSHVVAQILSAHAKETINTCDKYRKISIRNPCSLLIGTLIKAHS